MKTIILSALAASMVFLNACSDDMLDVKFDLPLGKVTFTLPAQTSSGTFDLSPTTIALNLDSIASANGVSLDKFETVKVKSCMFKILSPAGANFNALQSAEAFVRDPASGQATGKRIAMIENIPDGKTELELLMIDENVLDIIRKPFEISAKVVTTEPVSQATSIEATIVLEVVANPTNK